MFGPFRSNPKPYVEESPPMVKPKYPRLIIETPGATKRRLVEVKKDEFIVEKLVDGKDSMGADASFWMQEAKVADDFSRYQSSIEPAVVLWLIRQLEMYKR